MMDIDDMLALEIINALAPLTRRDDWWKTGGPTEAIKGALKKRAAMEWFKETAGTADCMNG
jgi:hypothetical protein